MRFEVFCNKVLDELVPFIERHQAQLHETLPTLYYAYDQIDPTFGDYDSMKATMSLLAELYDQNPSAKYFSSVIIKVVNNVCFDPDSKEAATIPADFKNHMTRLLNSTPLTFSDFWHQAYPTIKADLSKLTANWKKQLPRQKAGEIIATIADFIELLDKLNKRSDDPDYIHLITMFKEVYSNPQSDDGIKYILNVTCHLLKNICEVPLNNIPINGFKEYLDKLIFNTQRGYNKFLNQDKPVYMGFWSLVKEKAAVFLKQQADVWKRVKLTGVDAKQTMIESLQKLMSDIDFRTVDGYEALLPFLKEIKTLFDKDKTTQYLPKGVLNIMHNISIDSANESLSIPDEFKDALAKDLATLNKSPRSDPSSKINELGSKGPIDLKEVSISTQAIIVPAAACPPLTKFFEPLARTPGSSDVAELFSKFEDKETSIVTDRVQSDIQEEERTPRNQNMIVALQPPNP